MKVIPIRLKPGQDLRKAIEATVSDQGCSAAFVLSGIGSLSVAQMRLAGTAEPMAIQGDIELLMLNGSIAKNGGHLHGALATADGNVLGGHLSYGCSIRTTAEVLLGLLPEWDFSREPDEVTGYAELVVRSLCDNSGEVSGLDVQVHGVDSGPHC